MGDACDVFSRLGEGSGESLRDAKILLLSVSAPLLGRLCSFA